MNCWIKCILGDTILLAHLHGGDRLFPAVVYEIVTQTLGLWRFLRPISLRGWMNWWPRCLLGWWRFIGWRRGSTLLFPVVARWWLRCWLGEWRFWGEVGSLLSLADEWIGVPDVDWDGCGFFVEVLDYSTFSCGGEWIGDPDVDWVGDVFCGDGGGQTSLCLSFSSAAFQ